jgi:hypothetical protein
MLLSLLKYTSNREAGTMLIIVSREFESFYESLKSRQEANGTDRVILDRRSGKRRQASGAAWDRDRRALNRRLPLSDAERALMNVLGFTVLHRELRVISGERIPRKPPVRRAARQMPTSSKPFRQRAAS